MTLWQLIVVSITQGCLYGLIGLGFVLIYKSSETINFAQGDITILGTFLMHTLLDSQGFSFWSALPLVLIFLFVFGWILDKVMFSWLIGYPSFVIIILTIGLGLVLRSLIGAVWGYQPINIVPPEWGELGAITNASSSHLLLIAGTISLCLFQVVFFKYTKWGVALQAIAQNQLASYYVGIPVKRLLAISWGLGTVYAGVAGIFLGTVSMVDPFSGFIGLKAFAAAVIGGLGSLSGVMLGGMLIGIAEQCAGVFLPNGSQDFIAYLLMVVILIVRPHGLVSQVQLKKV